MPITREITVIQDWLAKFHELSAEGSRLDHAFYWESPTQKDVDNLKVEIAKLEETAKTSPSSALNIKIAGHRLKLSHDEGDLTAKWDKVQKVREETNLLANSIRDSLYLLNEEGSTAFLALQPVERENTGKSTATGKVVIQGDYDKYYRDAVLGGDPARPLADSSPFVSGGGGGYSFLTGKGELSTMRAAHNAEDLIFKLGLSTYNKYYREIDYTDPSTGIPGKKKWPQDLVGVTWNLIESEMYKVRTTADGHLIQLIRELPKTAESAVKVLGRAGVEGAELDKNWWPIEKEGVGGLARGGGREWIYDTGARQKLKRAHDFETFRYPSPLPADPVAAAKIEGESEAHKIRLDKMKGLMSEFPATLAESAAVLDSMLDDKRDKLKTPAEKTKFNSVRSQLRLDIDAAKLSAGKLKAELGAPTPAPAARDAYATSLDGFIATHEANLRTLEKRMLEARQILAAVPGELDAAGGSSGSPLITGAPAKTAGEWGKSVDKLRGLIKQFKDSYGRTAPPGYEAAVNEYNAWLEKRTPEGFVYIPDPIKADVKAEIESLNKYIDANRACDELEKCAIAFETTRKMPGGWSGALWEFEAHVKAGRVSHATELKLRDLIDRANKASSETDVGTGKGISASLLIIHEDMLAVSGSSVKIKGTGATVRVHTAKTDRVVPTKLGVTRGALPADTSEKLGLAAGELSFTDVEAGHGAVSLISAKSLTDGSVKNVMIGAGTLGDGDPTGDVKKAAKDLTAIALDHFHLDHINRIEKILFALDDPKDPTSFSYKGLKGFIVPHATNIPPSMVSWTERMIDQAKRLGASIVRLSHVDPNPDHPMHAEGKVVGQTVTIDGYTLFVFHDNAAVEAHAKLRAAHLGDTGTAFEDYATGLATNKYMLGKSRYVAQTDPATKGGLPAVRDDGTPYPADSIEALDKGSWAECLASGSSRAVGGKHHEYVKKFHSDIKGAGRFMDMRTGGKELGGLLNAVASAYVKVSDAGDSAIIIAHDLPVTSLASIASDIEASGVFAKVKKVLWKGAHHGGSLKVTHIPQATAFEQWCAFLAKHSVGMVDGAAAVVISCPEGVWHDGTIHAMRTHGFRVIVTDAISGSRVIPLTEGGKTTYTLDGAKSTSESMEPVDVKPEVKAFRAAHAKFDGWHAKAPDAIAADATALWKLFEKLNSDIVEATNVRKTRGDADGKANAADLALADKALLARCDTLTADYYKLEKKLHDIEGAAAGSKDAVIVPSTKMILHPDAKSVTLGGKKIPVHTAEVARVVPIVIGPKSAQAPEGWEEKVKKGDARLPAIITAADLERGEVKAEFDEKVKKLEDDAKKADGEAGKLVAELEAMFAPWSSNPKAVPKNPNAVLGSFDEGVASKVIPAADAARLKGLLKKAATLTLAAIETSLKHTIVTGKAGDDGVTLMGYNALRHEGYITESEARELSELMYRANSKMATGVDPGADEAKKKVAAGELAEDLKYFGHMGEDKGGLTEGPVDINSATAYQLCAALHISASLAENIVTTRKTIGGYKTSNDLLKVKGMDAKTLSRITPLIKVTEIKGDEKAPGAGEDKEEKKKTFGESMSEKYDSSKKMLKDGAEKVVEVAKKADAHAKKKNAQFDVAAQLIAKYKSFFSGLPSAKDLPAAELAAGLKALGKDTFESFLILVDPDDYPELNAMIVGLKSHEKAIVSALDLAVSIFDLYNGFKSLGQNPDIPQLINVLKSSQHLLGDLSAAVAAFKEYKVWDKLPEGIRSKLEGKGGEELAANLTGIIAVLEFVEEFKSLLEDATSGKLSQMPAADVFLRFQKVGAKGFEALAAAMDTPALKQYCAKHPGLESILKKIIPARQKVLSVLELGAAIADVYPKVRQFIADVEGDRISSPFELGSRVADLGSAIVAKYEVLVQALDAFGLMTPKMKQLVARLDQVMGSIQAVMGFVALFDKYKTFFEGMFGGKPGMGVVWPSLEEFSTLIGETQKATEVLFADKLLQDYIFSKYPQIEGAYKQISAKKEVFLASLGQAQRILGLYKQYEALYKRIETAGIGDIAPIFFDVLGAAANTIDELNATIELIDQWGIQLPPSVKNIAKQLQDPRLQEALKQMRVVLGIMRKYQGMFQGRQVPMEIKEVLRDILGAAEAGIRGFNAIMQYPSVSGYFARMPAPVQKAAKFVTQDPGLALINVLVKVLDTVDEASNLYNDLFNSDKDMDFGDMAQRLGQLLGKGVSTFDDAIKIASKYEDRLPTAMQKMLKRLQKFSIVRLIKIGGMVGDVVQKMRGYWDGIGSGSLGWVKGIIEFAKLMPSLVGDAFKIGKEVVLFIKEIGVGGGAMWRRIMKIPGVKKIAQVFKKVAAAVKGSKLIKCLKGIGKMLHLDKIAMILIDNIDVIEQFMDGGMTIEQAIGTAIEKAIKGMVMTAGSFVGGLAGRALGTAVGSAVGSVIPVIGTAVLGWVGGWLGDMLGSYLGGMLAEKIWNAFVGDGAIAGAAGGLLGGLRSKVDSALPGWLSIIGSVVDWIVEKLSGFVSTVMGFVKKAVGLLIDIIDNLADMGTMIKNAALKFFETVCSWLEPIGKWIKEMWDKYNPVELAKRGLKMVGGAIVSAGEAIGGALKSGWNTVSGWFSSERDGGGHATMGMGPMLTRLMYLAQEPGVGMSQIVEEYGQGATAASYLALVSFKTGIASEARIVEDQHGQTIVAGLDPSTKFYQMRDPRPQNAGATGDQSGDPVEYIYVGWDNPGSEAPGTSLSYGWIKKMNATIWPKPNTKFAGGAMSWWAGVAMNLSGKPESVRAKSKDGGTGSETNVFGVDSLGAGTPLGAGTQSEMSGALGGVGLGDVRIHTGAMGAGIAAKFNADAVTIGKDIFFGSGKYDTTSPEGKALIGHELTHVMQDPGAGSHHDHETEALGAEGQLRGYFRSKASGGPGMTHLKDGTGGGSTMRVAGGTKKPHTAHTDRQISPTQGHGPAFDAELNDKILQEVMKLAERERFESRERYGLWR